MIDCTIVAAATNRGGERWGNFYLSGQAFISLFAGSLAFGQIANATLGGSVSDSTGALIPGVSITATNTETGIVNMAVTNEAGIYQFASLQPGTYRVTAELPGQLIRSVVFGVTPSNPAILITVAIVVGLITYAACYAPVRRAVRLDPVSVLRHD
jgi:ABC-type antimicrobial peptide transport system permease subunit